VLVQDANIELVRPPVAVGRAAAGGFCEELTVIEGALGFGGHKLSRALIFIYEWSLSEDIVFLERKKMDRASFKKSPRF
jgi:hypothetical protein